MDPMFQDERISAYLDGQLPSDERAHFEDELARNSELRQVVDELRALRDSLQALPRLRLDDDFAQHVLRRAERAILCEPAAAANGSGSAPVESKTVQPADRAANSSSSVPKNNSPRSRRPWIWAAVAVAAAVVIMVFSQAANKNKNDQVAQRMSDERAATQGQQQLQHALPEGRLLARDNDLRQVRRQSEQMSEKRALPDGNRDLGNKGAAALSKDDSAIERKRAINGQTTTGPVVAGAKGDAEFRQDIAVLRGVERHSIGLGADSAIQPAAAPGASLPGRIGGVASETAPNASIASQARATPPAVAPSTVTQATGTQATGTQATGTQATGTQATGGALSLSSSAADRSPTAAFPPGSPAVGRGGVAPSAAGAMPGAITSGPTLLGDNSKFGNAAVDRLAEGQKSAAELQIRRGSGSGQTPARPALSFDANPPAGNASANKAAAASGIIIAEYSATPRASGAAFDRLLERHGIRLNASPAANLALMSAVRSMSASDVAATAAAPDEPSVDAVIAAPQPSPPLNLAGKPLEGSEGGQSAVAGSENRKSGEKARATSDAKLAAKAAPTSDEAKPRAAKRPEASVTATAEGKQQIARESAAALAVAKQEPLQVVYVVGSREQVLGLVNDLSARPAQYRPLAVASLSPAAAGTWAFKNGGGRGEAILRDGIAKAPEDADVKAQTDLDRSIEENVLSGKENEKAPSSGLRRQQAKAGEPSAPQFGSMKAIHSSDVSDAAIPAVPLPAVPLPAVPLPAVPLPAAVPPAAAVPLPASLDNPAVNNSVAGKPADKSNRIPEAPESPKATGGPATALPGGAPGSNGSLSGEASSSGGESLGANRSGGDAATGNNGAIGGRVVAKADGKSSTAATASSKPSDSEKIAEGNRPANNANTEKSAAEAGAPPASISAGNAQARSSPGRAVAKSEAAKDQADQGGGSAWAARMVLPPDTETSLRQSLAGRELPPESQSNLLQAQLGGAGGSAGGVRVHDAGRNEADKAGSSYDFATPAKQAQADSPEPDGGEAVQAVIVFRLAPAESRPADQNAVPQKPANQEPAERKPAAATNAGKPTGAASPAK